MATNMDYVQRRTEERIRLEHKYRDWKPVCNTIQDVLLWNRPKLFAVVFGITTFIVMTIAYLQLSIITFVALVALLYYAYQLLIIKYPNALQTIASKMDSSDSTVTLSADLFYFILDIVTWTKLNFQNNVDALLENRKRNSTKFTIHLGFVLLIGAYLGSLVSGFTLFVLFAYSILLGPGLVNKKVPHKAWAQAQPHYQKMMEKAEVYKQKVYKVLPVLAPEAQPQEPAAETKTPTPIAKTNLSASGSRLVN